MSKENLIFNQSKYNEFIKISEAFDIFIDKIQNFIDDINDIKLEEIELEQKDGHYLYEIKSFDKTNRYKMKIDAISGDVLEYKKKIKLKEKTELPKDYLEKVEEIVNKTLQDVGVDVKCIEIEIKMEDSIPEIEVKIKLDKKGAKYKYDLKTGKLLKKKI